MTVTATRTSDDTAARPQRSRLVFVLVAVIAIALAAACVALGFWAGDRSDSSASSTSGPTAVDVGFARDMATHHQQAVTMAGYVRDHPSDLDVAHTAYDIETSQSVQMGEMTGWLDDWGVSRTSGTPMSWMSGMHMHMETDGLMPGMATPDQLSKLMTLRGKPMDVLFLQLMIRHHQAGVAMAQYAETHASKSFVRTLASQMVAAQTGEIVQMEQMLRRLGGTPLPAPTI